MIVICRGTPGSGKSTYAKGLGILHVEADMYFVRDGKYRWNRDGVHKAHKWCMDVVYKAVDSGVDVVVANTFTTIKEMKPYLDLAKQRGVPCKVIKCVGKFRNVHGVPEETLQKMSDRWQDFPGEETYVPNGEKTYFW